MSILYFVLCHEKDQLPHPVIATSRDVLLKKLEAWDVSEKKLDELIVTGTATLKYQYKGEDKTATLYLDTTIV